MRAYEYEHVVTFEETNLVGNVYFTRYLSWQGRCRELFLRDHAPEVVAELERDLRLVTTRVTCDYFAELRALDEVVVRMTLRSASQTRVAMAFEYFRRTADGEELVARGEQEAACLRATGDDVSPTAVPAQLRGALDEYATTNGGAP
ncbi:MAG TPA: acyl-CoA thioesterase [Solirubrobacteraceae bacterium]|jgi:enediyne biosynthesis thioesterase|nr:acyl-CoA thioesterase [Solirubrobacteraceae bacterium]